MIPGTIAELYCGNSLYYRFNDSLGYTSDSFNELISALIESNEISGMPAKINGIALKVDNGMTEILGMGHLKFSEY